MVIPKKVNDLVFIVLGLKKEHLLLPQDALVLLFINRGSRQRKAALMRRVAIANVARLHLCVELVILLLPRILLLSVRNNLLRLLLTRLLELAVLVSPTVDCVGTSCCFVLCGQGFIDVESGIDLFNLKPLS